MVIIFCFVSPGSWVIAGAAILDTAVDDVSAAMAVCRTAIEPVVQAARGQADAAESVSSLISTLRDAAEGLGGSNSPMALKFRLLLAAQSTDGSWAVGDVANILSFDLPLPNSLDPTAVAVAFLRTFFPSQRADLELLVGKSHAAMEQADGPPSVEDRLAAARAAVLSKNAETNAEHLALFRNLFMALANAIDLIDPAAAEAYLWHDGGLRLGDLADAIEACEYDGVSAFCVNLQKRFAPLATAAAAIFEDSVPGSGPGQGGLADIDDLPGGDAGWGADGPRILEVD